MRRESGEITQFLSQVVILEGNSRAAAINFASGSGELHLEFP
jgi:hypothetical protein